ncbi:MAG: DUF4397 domain-containing protein [Ferruginibacter sp.]|nr:DUF4397 domain-containing protein [Chitinophagaceae bacterium]
MKLLYKIPACFCIVITLLIIQSCTKQEAKIVAQQQTNFTNSSLVQVYVATVNASRNYIYVDGAAVTGAALASGSLFPGGVATIGTNVPAGLRAFLVRDTLPAATQVPLVFAENMQNGKFHTIFLYDTISTPKQKTVLTNIVIPADTTARLRFANFVFSRTDVPAVDIFSKRRGVNLFTNVKVTDVSDFIPIPSAFNDTFFVRETGTTNQLAVFNGFNATQKRSYTLVFRGRYQTTTGTVVRTLSSFINY